MSKKLDPAKTQAYINDIQQLYREWTQLLPKLESARADWEKSLEIMDKLTAFYFGGHYLDCLDTIEKNGLKINLHTAGEYSIMGEDTLWDAFQSQQKLAWAWMKDAIAVLEPK